LFRILLDPGNATALGSLVSSTAGSF
jgi:hypothetical protein